MTSNLFESKIIDEKIAYWKFFEHAAIDSYSDAYTEFEEMVRRPEITKLMVVVDQSDAWDEAIHSLWIKTGEAAEENNISKWGIVTPSSFIREMTIKRLVGGGSFNKIRKYQYFVSQKEGEVLDWLRAR